MGQEQKLLRMFLKEIQAWDSTSEPAMLIHFQLAGDGFSRLLTAMISMPKKGFVSMKSACLRKTNL